MRESPDDCELGQSETINKECRKLETAFRTCKAPQTMDSANFINEWLSSNLTYYNDAIQQQAKELNLDSCLGVLSPAESYSRSCP